MQFTKRYAHHRIQTNLCIKMDKSMNKSLENPEFFFPQSFLLDYLVVEKIGEGKQACVFQVEDKHTGRKLAAKRYLSTEPEEISRIEREAFILKNLKISNIIQYEGFLSYENAGIFIILTEYFPGVSLADFLSSQSKGLSEEVQQQIIQNLQNVILDLHSTHIAHCDLNLSNILINPLDFSFRVIDLGLSKKISDGDQFVTIEGEWSTRPPSSLEVKSYYELDNWNLALIELSIFMFKALTTKKIVKLIAMNQTEANLEKVLGMMKRIIPSQKQEKS